ncbi:MAG: MFS transporter [Chloroflexi bacterium]|nr:MFS transporter [Chloroflexota bacterium]MBK6709737.1 MFS transporter [Chloroflexota bacterium]MBP6805013.1 MFS transporter [Chloroflexota bacterium]MBP7593398.1 MFS transporter [Chloroflexota bacterium]
MTAFTTQQQPPVTQREKLLKTIGYYAGFLCIGLAASVIGPTLPGLAENTNTQLGQISILFSARSVGFLIGALAGGRIYDRLPGHPVLAAGLLGMALTIALTPTISLLWLLVLVVLLLGISESMLDVGTNTMLPWLHHNNVAPYMNGLHFFFGLGALLSPIVVAQAILRSGDMTYAYWLLALIMLPAAVWILPQRSPRPAVKTAVTREAPPNYLLVSLITLFFFLYVGAETSFGGWIYTYAVRTNLATITMAAYLTSIFWGSLTVGRLLSVPLANRLRPRKILALGIVGSLLSVGVLLLFPAAAWAMWLGTIGLGFSMAPIFPTTLAMAERNMPVTGKTTGWFFAGASLGGMTLPWLVGQLFDITGPYLAMAAIGVGVLGTAVVFGVLLAALRRQPPR